MKDEEKRGIGIYCEICNKNQAEVIKGGVHNGERKLWLICKSCKEEVINQRVESSNTEE